MKITVMNRRNSRLVYVVSLKDWMNPDKFVIQAQIPYIGATESIRKDNYETSIGETYLKGGDIHGL
jgi:hypothetical protein